MIKKHLFSVLFLIFIVHTTHGMETKQKPSIFSQAMIWLRQKSQDDQKTWYQGYLSHCQLNQPQQTPESTQKPITSGIKQKPLTDQDIYVYAWVCNF